MFSGCLFKKTDMVSNLKYLIFIIDDNIKDLKGCFYY